MSETRFDVVGIGNAIVDVIARQPDDFLQAFDLVKGSMELIDTERAVQLYDAMSDVTQASGGSAGNTMAGVASFGGRSAFIGKVANDELGTVFATESASVGVHFDVERASGGEPTGRSMIIVTPDAERTMSTFLGAATTLYRSDIDEELVSASEILYCEGYIWDVDVTKDAISHAVAVAKAAGRKISFTLSDSFCVERHYDDWHRLLNGDIDILFANEQELAALTGLGFDDAIEAVRGRCEVLCATRGPQGSIIATAGSTVEIAPVPVAEVVDTTGAGDQYAAGVLFGLSQNMDLAQAGHLGSVAASATIAHMGPRPSVALSTLVPS